jgi:hypothetical protein
MGDPSGPWRHRGDGDSPDDGTPRHLRSRPAGGYDLGYGQRPRDGRDVTDPAMAGGYGVPRTPRYVDDVHGGWDRAEADTGRIPVVPDTAVPRPPAPGAPAHTPTPTPPVHAQDWPAPGDVGPGGGGARYDGYGDDGYRDDDEDRGGKGVAGSVRAAAAEAAWRYRAAPLWVRISADLAAAGLVLVLIVGVSLALRQEGGPEQAASADTRPQTTTVSTTTTTVATTTTTVATTTTVPTTTTTTTEPPTTTTAAPIVPLPTEAPTTTSSTSTTQPVNYRSCRDAMGEGALPLVAGEPGYHPRLDSDGDGEACDDFEDWDGRGD